MTNSDTATDEVEGSQSSSLFGPVLEPGSSFNPAFLLVVDGAFAFLFVVLVAMAVLTQGNVHLIVLTFIELALWASVKWFVHEWRMAQSNSDSTGPGDPKSKED